MTDEKPILLAVQLRESLPGQPLQAKPFNEEDFEVYYPIDDRWFRIPRDRVEVLGRWEDKSSWSLGGDEPVTWNQLAHHAVGQILRQNVLVDRLDAKGISRFKKETYPRMEPSGFHEKLILSFDELASLLEPLEDELIVEG